MSDQPQYPTYPGDEGPPSQPAPPTGYGQVPPPGYGQVPPPGYGQAPPPGFGQAPPAYGQPSLGYGYGQVPPGYPQRPRTSNKAVIGLVLGIVSMLFCYLGVLIGPAAIIVSVMARKEINAARPGEIDGQGMATAGLVTGIIGTVFWAGVSALLIIGVFVA